MNIIGELLKQNRQTAYRLAKNTGISESSVSRIISGKTSLEKVPVGTLYRIAKELNVPLEYLLTRGASCYTNKDDCLHTKYITELYALNLMCSLDTPGDWHQSALDWTRPIVRRSWESIFGDYGLEWHEKIPQHETGAYVANHIRACLDMLDVGKFSELQGMKRDYIDNDFYDEEIFEQVYKLRFHPNWREIAIFMHKEYGMRWRVWINSKFNIQS